MVSEQGRKMDTFEQSMSVMVRIVSYPPDGGNLVMKSSAIVLKGRAFSAGVMGKSGGWVGLRLIFDIWQVTHPQMYSVMKVFMLGHQ
jgi:hypothetical protein